MVIRPARHGDLPAVCELLKAAGLPTQGVEGCLATLIVGASGGAIVAAGAVEPLGRAALLRSVVVAPHCRGRGWGARLTARLLALARRMGMVDAYVLTTTNPEFFAALGFVPVPRDSAPATVRSSRQFSALCPDSALLMRHSLAMLPAASR